MPQFNPSEQAHIPEGYRINQLDENCYVPEKWDIHKHMWRSFDKGRSGYYSYKSWPSALRFIEKKEAAKSARQMDSENQ